MSRSSRERGAGTLSTVFGLTVVLVTVATCAHVLADLRARATVDAVAQDAATDVATSGATGDELRRVEAEAVDRARVALGPGAGPVALTFEPSPPDRVVVRVRAPGIDGGLDRRITVWREPAGSR